MDGSARIESYRDLIVWQRSIELGELCYCVSRDFPREELYGMVSQIRRCAASVAANIAEGYGRDSSGAYVQFLKTAQGSLKELETHFILSRRVGLTTAETEAQVIEKSEEVGKMLRSLIRAIQKHADS